MRSTRGRERGDTWRSSFDKEGRGMEERCLAMQERHCWARDSALTRYLF